MGPPFGLILRASEKIYPNKIIFGRKKTLTTKHIYFLAVGWSNFK